MSPCLLTVVSRTFLMWSKVFRCVFCPPSDVRFNCGAAVVRLLSSQLQGGAALPYQYYSFEFHWSYFYCVFLSRKQNFLLTMALEFLCPSLNFLHMQE